MEGGGRGGGMVAGVSYSPFSPFSSYSLCSLSSPFFPFSLSSSLLSVLFASHIIPLSDRSGFKVIAVKVLGPHRVTRA